MTALDDALADWKKKRHGQVPDLISAGDLVIAELMTAIRVERGFRYVDLGYSVFHCMARDMRDTAQKLFSEPRAAGGATVLEATDTLDRWEMVENRVSRVRSWRTWEGADLQLTDK
jgi:hypothetical protein